MTRMEESWLTAGPDWYGFHGRLVHTLASLAEDEFLVISRRDVNRYVQFAAQGSDGMRVETTANTYLEPWEQLAVGDLLALDRLGWTPPTSPLATSPEHDPHGSPNYFRDWPTPVPHGEIACLAVATLTVVHRVDDFDLLAYDAFHATGRPIDLPELGLARPGT
ncbi:MAG: hypothetical protein R8F63_00765 [Acidimicrobiales bacterium]|nr:hypothetical protein [Acidimicrobiales bacterium]